MDYAGPWSSGNMNSFGFNARAKPLSSLDKTLLKESSFLESVELKKLSATSLKSAGEIKGCHQAIASKILSKKATTRLFSFGTQRFGGFGSRHFQGRENTGKQCRDKG